MRTADSRATVTRNVRLRRRHPATSNEKPHRVTIHAAGDQHQTIAMGPGDGVGVAGIRVSILADGTIDVWPIEADPLMRATPHPHPPDVVTGLTKEMLRREQRSSRRR